MYPRRRTLVTADRQAIFGFVSAVSACFALIGGCGSDFKRARPNHVGGAIARYKRAGCIEERDGKLYAT
jgi:hypothetical protein